MVSHLPVAQRDIPKNEERGTRDWQVDALCQSRPSGTTAEET